MSAPKILSCALQRPTTPYNALQRHTNRGLTTNIGVRKGVLLQVRVSSEQVGAGDNSELVGRCGPCEHHGFQQIAPVSAAGRRIADVKKPSQSRKHAGQLLEVPVSQPPIHSTNDGNVIYTKHCFFVIDTAPLSIFNNMAGRT